eukprot:TRINITY_DN31757_c0_g1_i1.p1 TRINITY_DN31757_c0_g1~~TRINITY_DN31757_c0_g1_i1.p1  ORF type:complete len:1000 (+),score=68.62 TRINITY_DN31757_c0_g1_i1:47-3001(+)
MLACFLFLSLPSIVVGVCAPLTPAQPWTSTPSRNLQATTDEQEYELQLLTSILASIPQCVEVGTANELDEVECSGEDSDEQENQKFEDDEKTTNADDATRRSQSEKIKERFKAKRDGWIGLLQAENQLARSGTFARVIDQLRGLDVLRSSIDYVIVGNSATGHVYVVSRGSDKLSAHATTNDQISMHLGLNPRLLEEVLRRTRNLLSVVQAVSATRRFKGPVIWTGHSLGGTIAEIAFIMNGDSTDQAITFDAAGLSLDFHKLIREITQRYKESRLYTVHTRGSLASLFQPKRGKLVRIDPDFSDPCTWMVEERRCREFVRMFGELAWSSWRTACSFFRMCAAKPPRLGGVSLNATATVVGATFDRDQKTLSIISNVSIPGRAALWDADDLATAFRAVYDHEVPVSFSLDPADAYNPDGEWQRKVYVPNMLAGTSIGHAMWRADWLLKQLALDISYNDATGNATKDFATAIKQYVPEYQSPFELPFDGRSGHSRIWITTDAVEFTIDGTSATIAAIKMSVNAMHQEIGTDGRLRDVHIPSSSTDALWARVVSTHWDKLVGIFPEFRRLRDVASLVALARWAREILKVPRDAIPWLSATTTPVLEDFPVDKVPVLKNVLENEHAGWTVSGGVAAEADASKISLSKRARTDCNYTIAEANYSRQLHLQKAWMRTKLEDLLPAFVSNDSIDARLDALFKEWAVWGSLPPIPLGHVPIQFPGQIAEPVIDARAFLRLRYYISKADGGNIFDCLPSGIASPVDNIQSCMKHAQCTWRYQRRTCSRRRNCNLISGSWNDLINQCDESGFGNRWQCSALLISSVIRKKLMNALQTWILIPQARLQLKEFESYPKRPCANNVPPSCASMLLQGRRCSVLRQHGYVMQAEVAVFGLTESQMTNLTRMSASSLNVVIQESPPSGHSGFNVTVEDFSVRRYVIVDPNMNAAEDVCNVGKSVISKAFVAGSLLNPVVFVLLVVFRILFAMEASLLL